MMDLRSELGRRKYLVEGRLREFFEERRGKLDGILREALEALEDLTLRGGKRVRASLVMMGYRAATGEEPRQILDPAAAVELLQSYLLIHDDVMDRSDLRRGGPTVHRMFSERYGDEWLGISLAITVGDLADSYAQQLIAESDFPPENVLAALGVYNTMVEYTGYGQILDLLGPHVEADVDYVLKTHLLKTSMYTFIGPLLLGATLAGADQDLMEALARYGASAGIAFQLHDDYLGLYGEEEVIGKPATSDLEEGKRTVLVVEALRRAGEGEREALLAALGKKGITREELEAVRRIVRETGALEFSRELEEQHLREAIEAVEGARMDDFVREFLVELAKFSVSREA